MTPDRVVLDNNVLLSALLFHSGALSWLRAAWRSGGIRLLASRQTVAELVRVLAYPKFSLDAEEQRDLLDDYLPCCETILVPDPPPTVPKCRDPSDRPFLELALAGRADALVTGDADLLALTDAFLVPIMSPTAFRQRLSHGEKAGR